MEVVVDGPAYLCSAGISAVEAANYVTVRLPPLSGGGGNDQAKDPPRFDGIYFNVAVSPSAVSDWRV